MSNQGWRQFLASDGVADWVVLHGGAVAVFRVPSLVQAVRLAEAVAHVLRPDGSRPSRRCAGDPVRHRGAAGHARCRLLARCPRVAEMADDNAVDPLGDGSTVWIQDLDPAKPLRHAMHVDVSVAREQSAATELGCPGPDKDRKT